MKKKKLFELAINGVFSQYLLPSEIKLLKFDIEIVFTLTPIEVTEERYKLILGK